MNENNLETIILGGGCFWCTEAVFLRVHGVEKVTSGYAGGETENPSYEDVLTGNTGHAETVKLDFNPDVISLEEILEIFFAMHDPTSLNRQGSDAGTQYRSIVLWANEGQKSRIEKFIESKKLEYAKPIVTEIKKLEEFYPAEEYHQNYFAKNPEKAYCQLVIAPKIRKMGL